MASKQRVIQPKNAHLKNMDTDFLYHIAINVPNTSNAEDIQKLYGDVKVVCMGGTVSRMKQLAYYLHREVYGNQTYAEPVDLAVAGHRYAMFKVGQVLCVSHGVGSSTMSVILHELIKLVHYAKCDDPVFVRMGTCGGVGVEAGTVIITKDAYNGLLKNEHEIAILGERKVRAANFDANLRSDLLACAKEMQISAIEGNTMSTDCFYEGQGRTDGASCDYTEADKIKFLERAHELGIRNIEMEATMFSSLTKHIGIRAADVCVAMLNRLNGDQVILKPGDKERYEQHLNDIIGQYVRRFVLNKHS